MTTYLLLACIAPLAAGTLIGCLCIRRRPAGVALGPDLDEIEAMAYQTEMGQAPPSPTQRAWPPPPPPRCIDDVPTWCSPTARDERTLPHWTLPFRGREGDRSNQIRRRA